ncbi:MAG: endo alpha-1,4 polygalactosaminidase [Spirochaetaceae bacterium]|nr:MAG: endo alpha-1,4 polygalactosaminidase [Spirochaetaceae bacterium]
MIPTRGTAGLRRLWVLVALALAGAGGCASGPEEANRTLESDDPQLYKQRMRELVISLSRHARALDPGFILIPQNGNELLTADGTLSAAPALDYIRSIDGIGREDLFYGYNADNRETPPEAIRYMLPFLHLAVENELTVMVIDYCRQRSKIDESYNRNHQEGFISFTAPRRNLTVIPGYPNPVFAEHSADVQGLAEARNFLFLINPGAFADKEHFLSDLRRTNYDLLVIDAFVEGAEGPEWLEREDIRLLKRKDNGGSRLVISYLSIGEAESYRYYWDRNWDRNRDGRPDAGSPAWLAGENPNWQGNYKVRYWDEQWQGILFGSAESYLDQIILRDFDGVYLDIIDAFEFFEEQGS